LRMVPLSEEEERVLPTRTRCGDMVGQSPAMIEVFDTIERLGPTDVTTLIESETGTGKELVAETLHAISPRRNQPFVVLDCSALGEGALGHTIQSSSMGRPRRATRFTTTTSGGLT